MHSKDEFNWHAWNKCLCFLPIPPSLRALGWHKDCKLPCQTFLAVVFKVRIDKLCPLTERLKLTLGCDLEIHLFWSKLPHWLIWKVVFRDQRQGNAIILRQTTGQSDCLLSSWESKPCPCLPDDWCGSGVIWSTFCTYIQASQWIDRYQQLRVWGLYSCSWRSFLRPPCPPQQSLFLIKGL